MIQKRASMPVQNDQGLADFKKLAPILNIAPEFSRSLAGSGLERAIERPDRIVAQIQCYAHDRQSVMSRICKLVCGVPNSQVVKHAVEIPVAAGLIDQSPQAMLRASQLTSQRLNSQPILLIASLRYEFVKRLCQRYICRSE
jgi:hypothetical protein